MKEHDLAPGQYLAWLQNIDMSPRYAQQREEAGGWIRWLDGHVDFTRQHAHRFVTIYEEMGGPDVTRVLHDRSLRFLYEIATLPPDERTREHTLKSGVTKQPDEMTVREVKAALKAEREARERAEARAEKDAVI